MEDVILKMREHYFKNESLLNEPSKFLYFWQNAIYHFNLAQYSEALDWIDLVQNTKSDFREDIQTLSRTLLLIIHFELGNKYFLDSCLNSTYRFLKKKNHFYDIEKLIFQFIKKINRTLTSNSTNIRKQFMLLHGDLQSLIGNSRSHLSFRSVNFVQWVESHI